MSASSWLWTSWTTVPSAGGRGGAVASRRMKDLRDYFAAGKRLGYWSVAFSARATGESAWLLLGLDGVQLLGGHGYTKEHPVERWYRDLRAIGVAEGVVVL